jgi:hypothetical protein
MARNPTRDKSGRWAYTGGPGSQGGRRATGRVQRARRVGGSTALESRRRVASRRVGGATQIARDATVVGPRGGVRSGVTVATVGRVRRGAISQNGPSVRQATRVSGRRGAAISSTRNRTTSYVSRREAAGLGTARGSARTFRRQMRGGGINSGYVVSRQAATGRG